LTTVGTSRESWRRDPRSGWLVIAFVGLAGFVAVVLLAMLWPSFDGLDAVVSSAVRATRNPFSNHLAGWLTSLGDLEFVIPVAAALMLWMAVRRNWAAVVYIFMTVGGGWLLGNDVIKNIVRRPRPIGVNIAPISSDYSLPSSHSLAAFLLFATLCVIVMLNLPTGSHLKRWVAAGSAIVILAVGYSRVYLGVHWVGDVVAAWLLGWAWWSFTTATYFGAITEERRSASRPAGSSPSAE
jgi:membrane-associated phospholipid phosphatase